MHDIALVPGAARYASAMWPLQARDDPTIHPIDYSRGYAQARYAHGDEPLLVDYARRVYHNIVDLDRPVDLYAWSMGACVACGVVAFADKHAPGLIRKVVMINYGVFGGPPPHAFHQAPSYLQYLWYRYLTTNRATRTAETEIRQHIPDYEYRCNESPQAMQESGDGVMYLPEDFDRSRLSMFYSTDDKIVPPDVSHFVAQRAGVEPQQLIGKTHNLPTLDTSGAMLEVIRNKNP